MFVKYLHGDMFVNYLYRNMLICHVNNLAKLADEACFICQQFNKVS